MQTGQLGDGTTINRLNLAVQVKNSNGTFMDSIISIGDYFAVLYSLKVMVEFCLLEANDQGTTW